MLRFGGSAVLIYQNSLHRELVRAYTGCPANPSVSRISGIPSPRPMHKSWMHKIIIPFSKTRPFGIDRRDPASAERALTLRSLDPSTRSVLTIPIMKSLSVKSRFIFDKLLQRALEVSPNRWRGKVSN